MNERTLHCRVPDPHYFIADPDPAFYYATFHFNAASDPDPAPLQSDVESATTGPKGPPWLHFEPPPSIVSVYGFELLKLLNFDFNVVRIQIFSLMRIRIQLPKITRIRFRIRTPGMLYFRGLE